MSPGLTLPSTHVVGYAAAALGKPYKFAGAGPDAYDCSGLALAAWAPWVKLPHEADQQAALCKPLKSFGLHLEPGDLVFYYTPITHVAIFCGYSAAGTPVVIAATNEQRGVEFISITQYAPPVLIARPPYVGWHHAEPSY